MLDSKKSSKIIAIITTVVVLVCFLMVSFPDMFSGVSRNINRNDYPEVLFGGNIINIDISVDEAEWDNMIENKMSKPYIACDMTINGEQFDSVGIRPKGNSSLTSTQSDRVGFRIDFDHYVDNQTCHGLKQFVLNNIQADSTYMKDYIAYDLMQYEGVDAPLHTFAYITRNGEPFGVYLAAEVYEEAYLKRVFRDTSVRLYNVKNSDFNAFEDAVVDAENATVISSKGISKEQGMGGMMPPGGPGGPGGMPPGPPPGMQGGQEEMPPQPPQMQGGQGEMPPPPPGMQGGQGEMPPPPPQMQGGQGEMAPQPPGMQGGQGGPGGPPGMGGSGGDLVYTDDSTSSYKSIFANAVFDDTNARDYARVIRAIKYLNKENVTQAELETYWNVYEILRYLAVHTFMVNSDSYTGHMMQNYYIAEQNGKLSILPWDYNLSFGSMGPGGPPSGPPGTQMSSEERSMGGIGINQATQTINFAIDTPVSGVNMEDRPLVSVLLGFDEYRDAYHHYLSELSEYVPGDFINKLEIIENDIYPYIELDATAFCTPEEHLTGFEILKEFLKLRCLSIKGQLNGSIPSVTSEQTNELLIQSDISLNDMGSMGGPDGMPPPPPGMQDGQGGMPPGPPPGMQGGQGGRPPGPPPGMQDGQGGMPPPPPGMPGMTQNQNNNYAMIAAALAILCVALIGMRFYKRNY